MESQSQSIPLSPFMPVDPAVATYDIAFGGYATALEHSGWRDEVISWKESCYVHGGLNPTLTYRLSGPDVTRMLADVSVNSFQKFSVGASKHLVMCNERGNMMTHGMCLRTGEDEFLTYWLAPYVNYFVESPNFDYDVRGEDLTGRVFLFQVAGPRSLEALEEATGEDLHDINFLRHRPAKIVGGAAGGGDAAVRIIRVGMAGTLGYEVHGDIEDAQSVFAAIQRAGEPFGMRRLGRLAYLLHHSENGFVQSGVHSVRAWGEDEGFTEYAKTTGWGARQFGGKATLLGSLGEDDIAARYLNPFDAGWGHIVKFDHDFIGRAALEPLAADPPRRMVTFEWDPEDIADVLASQLRPGEEPYKMIDTPMDSAYFRHRGAHFADQVLVGGEPVGYSTGRLYSEYYRAMISIGPLAAEHAKIGTEVQILWGDPGTRQKEIRAKVARFPYLDLPRNEQIDVESIPRRKF